MIELQIGVTVKFYSPTIPPFLQILPMTHDVTTLVKFHPTLYQSENGFFVGSTLIPTLSLNEFTVDTIIFPFSVDYKSGLFTNVQSLSCQIMNSLDPSTSDMKEIMDIAMYSIFPSNINGPFTDITSSIYTIKSAVFNDNLGLLSLSINDGNLIHNIDAQCKLNMA